MAIRIWETDPENAPKPWQRFADDQVGRFRSGYMEGRRPVALDKWRVTTGDPEVADAVHQLLGGEKPREWNATGEDRLEVFTAADKVKVIVERPEHLRTEMVLWGRTGAAIRRCDGVEQFGEDAKGEPCVCPRSFEERKEAARKGTGCQPSVSLRFRLADDPELGLFRFTSSSWSLVRDLARDSIEERLADVYEANDSGPVYVRLGLETVSFEAKDTGQKRQFIKPVIEIIGPAPVEVSGPDQDDEPPF